MDIKLKIWYMYDKNKYFYIKSENFKCAEGNVFLELINVQTQIKPCRRNFLLKTNKRTFTSIRYTRVPTLSSLL